MRSPRLVLAAATTALERVDRKLTSYRVPVDGLVTACRAADKLSGQAREFAKVGIGRASKELDKHLHVARDEFARGTSAAATL